MRRKRGTVEPCVLFNGKHIYDLVEERRGLLKVAYEALPDDEALNEAATQALKKKFMLDVPTLRMNDWTSERREMSPYSTEIIAYIPFDGDPAVFDVKPSAFNGMFAYGEIVNHEILVRIRPNSADFDIPAYVGNQLKEVEWPEQSARLDGAYEPAVGDHAARGHAVASANDREQSEARRQHRHSSATAEAGTRR
jgi:hypothetical protein